ncbi:hypothetical protein BJX64DRAFT_137680 [Aspergillus heterothallicus]
MSIFFFSLTCPPYCGWEELKDYISQTALHIRHAIVYHDQDGSHTGLGQIIIKNEAEAWRTFHKLCAIGWEGKSLVVTLARVNAPARPIAGPVKAPVTRIRAVSSP